MSRKPWTVHAGFYKEKRWWAATKFSSLHSSSIRLVFGTLYHSPLSERWPGNLDRSDATFPSVDRLELLSLSAFTDWINIYSCVASGATIRFILQSTLVDKSFRSSNWDCRLPSTSLADSAKMCTLPISTNCGVGVLFPSDMINFFIEEKKSSV